MQPLSITELAPRTCCTFSGELSFSPVRIVSQRRSPRLLRALLIGGDRRPMISPMTTARPQQRYDHRLRELVHRTGDLTIATDLGVPSVDRSGVVPAENSVRISTSIFVAR